MTINLNEYNGQDLRTVMEVVVDKINELETIIAMDAELRKRNPVLQDAYKKYQSIKNLTT